MVEHRSYKATVQGSTPCSGTSFSPWWVRKEGGKNEEEL